jgi:hypothetical protein
LLPNLLRLQAHSNGSVAARAAQLSLSPRAGGERECATTHTVHTTCNADTDFAEEVARSCPARTLTHLTATEADEMEADTWHGGGQVDEQVDEQPVDVATVYHFQTQLDSLVAMGFEGSVLRDLLEVHSGSVAAVVNAVIGA